MWANAVFFCHVLRILLSEFDKGQDKPSSGTQESCPRTSGHPMSRIRSLMEQRFVLMMKMMEFHGLETVDKPKWTSEKPFRCADAQWWLGNDSQSSPASLKKLSSKSNNAYKEKAGPDQSKTICGK